MTDCIGVYLRTLAEGGLDKTLTALYGEQSVQVQRQRYSNLLRRMEKWHAQERCLLLSTPGRTELGGNHTDHNNGVVLAAGVHFDILAAACAVDGDVIRIRSEGFKGAIEVDVNDVDFRPEEEGEAVALVRGVVAGFKARGWNVGGFDACLVGDVPMGAGLSSSAAFEICIGQILDRLFNGGQRSSVELATVAQEAENVFFGKPCGLMDQIACAQQGVLSIDFANPVDPLVTEVDFDFEDTDYQLVVVDTGGSHADLTPEYAAIPEEIKRAARVLGQEKARGLTVDQVLSEAATIRRKAGDRALLRLIHFIEESDRAVLQAAVLRDGNIGRFLELVRESGDSSWRLLQNCISTTNYLEQPIPAALVLTERFLAGDGAWRIQGGGFAGTIQAYIPRGKVNAYRKFMEGMFGSGAVLPLKVRRPGLGIIRPEGVS